MRVLLSLRDRLRPALNCYPKDRKQLLFSIFAALIWLTVVSRYCSAQSAYLYAWVPQPYSNQQPAEYGYVEQANGHLHLEIPLGETRLNRSGGSATKARLVYDSNFWYPYSYDTTSYSWAPGTTWHLLPQPTEQGFGDDGSGTYVMGGTDQDGLEHDFTCEEDCYSTEGRGVWLAEWGLYGPDGSNIVHFDTQEFGGKATATDPNGNYIAVDGGYNLPEIYAEQGMMEFYDTSNIPFLYYYEKSTDTGVPGPLWDDLYTAANMNSSGGNSSYTVHWVSIEANTDFQSQRVSVAECTSTASDPCLIDVVSEIVLPDSTTFNFKYDCDSTLSGQASYCSSPGGQSTYYGGLTQMTTPQTGVYTYSYAPFIDSYGDASLILQSRSNGTGTWKYSQSASPLTTCKSYTSVGCTQTMTTIEPNGRKTVTTNIMNNGAWPISENVTDSVGNNLQLTTTQWDFSHSNAFLGYAAAYIQKQWDTTTLWDSTGAAKTQKTAYTYDSPQTGNITKLQQWGYYSGTNPSFPSIADVTTYTGFYAPSNSPIADSTDSNVPKGGTNVINRPSNITVCSNTGSDSACNGSGSRLSQQIITYDSYSASGPSSVTGVANHDDQSYGSKQLVRGNPTSMASWATGSQYSTVNYAYDTTGQVVSKTDANNNLTTYSYADNYYVDNGTSSPSPYTPATPTHAYATVVTLPTVHGASFTESTAYYYGNQKPAFQTDINGNNTYYHYSDPLDRVTQIVYPLGWTLNKYTSATEIDVYQAEAVTGTTPSSTCTTCLHTSTSMDGLGRVVETVAADGSKVDVAYNSMGLVESKSNPYFTLSDATYGVTTYAYDILDRLCMQNNPDNTPSQSATCTSKGSSAVQFTYVLNGGYKTDENGNQWGFLYDSLNRLSSVTEPNGTVTQYTYDILGNLLTTAQPSEQRTFTYDGLSRLVTAANPESGTVCYGLMSGSTCSGGYDGNGNLVSRTNARGTITTYAYDAWNRLISKSYSDTATPISCYQFDATGVGNGKGSLANAWTQAAGTSCTGSQQSGFSPVVGQYLTLKASLAYDAMGRETSEQQCTPSNCTSATHYALGYQYDLAGNLLSLSNSALTVPGGSTPLTLTYKYDSGGRQYNLISNWSDTTHPSTLFNAPSFYPLGRWENATYGSDFNLTRTYDTRFRIHSEADTGSAPATATSGSATVTITGTEQKQ